MIFLPVTFTFGLFRFPFCYNYVLFFKLHRKWQNVVVNFHQAMSRNKLKIIVIEKKVQQYRSFICSLKLATSASRRILSSSICCLVAELEETPWIHKVRYIHRLGVKLAVPAHCWSFLLAFQSLLSDLILCFGIAWHGMKHPAHYDGPWKHSYIWFDLIWTNLVWNILSPICIH